MLLVLATFRQGVHLVSTVVVVAESSRAERNDLPGELRIDIKQVVATKDHLHQPSTDLRNNLQSYPFVGELSRPPTLVVDGLHGAPGRGCRPWTWLGSWSHRRRGRCCRGLGRLSRRGALRHYIWTCQESQSNCCDSTANCKIGEY